MEEPDQVLWALEPLKVAAQHDWIPAGVDEVDSLAQHCGQLLHGLAKLTAIDSNDPLPAPGLLEGVA
jgi:hypothetical protein